MRTIPILIFILFIIVGFYWMTKGPYSSFDNRQIKLSNGRDVVCKDSTGSGRYRVSLSGSVVCYDVTKEYILSDQYPGIKIHNSKSPEVKFLSIKYSFLKDLKMYFLCIGVFGLLLSIPKRFLDKNII